MNENNADTRLPAPLSGLQVLHLEDNITDSELFTAAMEDAGLNCDVFRVDTEADFTKALAERRFDLIISDFSLPGFNGKAALSYANRNFPDTPFIFVSGTIGEDAAIDSLVNGATDYVLKHKFTRLAPAVQRALRETRERNERRQAEQTTRKTEARYRCLFEESKDAIFMRTTGGQLIDINPAGVEMLGYESRDQLLAVPPSSLHTDPEKWRELEAVIARQGFVRDFEVRLTTRTGAALIVLETTTAVRDEETGAIACHGIWRDVTEQRKLQTQFVLSQRLECVGQLAGGLAHDFNNLLSVVLGYTELVQGLVTGQDTVSHHMGQIHGAAARAAVLTRQLLAFSRKQVLEPARLNLNQIVRGIQEMLQPLMGRQIELTTRLASDLGTINADAGQLEQVFMNLAINARDAMPKGGRIVIETAKVVVDADYVRAHPPMTEGAFVMVAFTDDGTGMDSRTRERIFEPFFTTKDPGKGTGLGLSMVYGIVKQSGGYIWVDSQLGQGTTFTIFLPSASGLPDDLAPAAANQAHGPAASETILVIEDQGDLRDLMSEALHKCGYQVLSARDGEEALKMCETHQGEIHLAITDVRLPKFTGPEFVQALRDIRPNAHVLYISAYASDVPLTPGPADRAANLLVKPFQLAALSTKVREILDGPIDA